MTEAHPPPAPQGKRIRLRYMTQVKTRPPAFVIMATHTEKVPESYLRYLVNGLRNDFDMPGTPIRIRAAARRSRTPTGQAFLDAVAAEETHRPEKHDERKG